ncbi:MAG: DUF4126 domain-containing protein [Polyangiaceae bacterium]
MPTSDLLTTLGVAAGLAWGSGLRPYAVVLAAGVLGRFGLLHLPGSLSVLGSSWVIGVSAALAIAEFLADKIAAFDSVWDAIQTFVRVPAGAVLAAAAWTGDAHPALVVTAFVLGGTLAATTHATKASARALVNMSPEPFSNVVTSFAEEVLVAVGLAAAFLLPVVFVLLLAAFVAVSIVVLRKAVRAGLRVFDARAAREGPNSARTSPPAGGLP